MKKEKQTPEEKVEAKKDKRLWAIFIRNMEKKGALIKL